MLQLLSKMFQSWQQGLVFQSNYVPDSLSTIAIWHGRKTLAPHCQEASSQTREQRTVNGNRDHSHSINSFTSTIVTSGCNHNQKLVWCGHAHTPSLSNPHPLECRQNKDHPSSLVIPLTDQCQLLGDSGSI